MLFRRRKKEKKESPYHDKTFHNIFRIGALILVGYIIINSFSSPHVSAPTVNNEMLGEVKANLTEEQINQKVKEAFDAMYENPEFKRIKKFVEHVESSADQKNGSVLKTTDGILIYIPQHMISVDNNTISKVTIDSDEAKYEVTGQKKKITVEKDSKAAENKDPEADKSE